MVTFFTSIGNACKFRSGMYFPWNEDLLRYSSLTDRIRVIKSWAWVLPIIAIPAVTLRAQRRHKRVLIEYVMAQVYIA